MTAPTLHPATPTAASRPQSARRDRARNAAELEFAGRRDSALGTAELEIVRRCDSAPGTVALGIAGGVHARRAGHGWKSLGMDVR